MTCGVLRIVVRVDEFVDDWNGSPPRPAVAGAGRVPGEPMAESGSAGAPHTYRASWHYAVMQEGLLSAREIQQVIPHQATLGVVNTCAWYLSWDAATARKDHVASEGALKVMAGELAKYPPPQDLGGREFVTRVAERAKAGDPALARQYVLANCDTTAWIGR